MFKDKRPFYVNYFEHESVSHHTKYKIREKGFMIFSPIYFFQILTVSSLLDNFGEAPCTIFETI